MANTIEDFVKLLPDKVRSDLTIVTPDSLGQDFFLHISPDNMSKKKYIPFISHRQAKSEDRTVPRITVSDYLYGCITGYDALVSDTLYSEPNKKRGLYIHELKFKKALSPTKKLVYDQNRSNEHWLVTYDNDTKEYEADKIGKIFISNINIKFDLSKNGSTLAYELYVEVTKPEGIKFSKNIFLKKGYWFITVPNNSDDGWDKDTKITSIEITKEVFMSTKSTSAALLSYVDKPTITKW